MRELFASVPMNNSSYLTLVKTSVIEWRTFISRPNDGEWVFISGPGWA